MRGVRLVMIACATLAPALAWATDLGIATRLVVPASRPALVQARWADQIAQASLRFGIPAHWIARIMAAESGGRRLWQGRPITSRAGAMGLMQVMPGTWADMRAAYGLGPDPHDPHDNILAGAAYLRILYDRFGYPGLFAAYNAGPARYADYLATGRPLPAETRAYLAKMTQDGVDALPILPAPRDVPPRQSLFVLGGGVARRDQATAPSTDMPPADRLFAVRIGR
jgi:soluble lytic murein transglycosylase-like protein